MVIADIPLTCGGSCYRKPTQEVNELPGRAFYLTHGKKIQSPIHKYGDNEQSHN